jgi:hypothetical protein
MLIYPAVNSSLSKETNCFTEVGAFDGFVDVGGLVGLVEGLFDGEFVGNIVGLLVGLISGLFDGDVVGVSLGLVDGLFEGIVDGL